MALAEYGDPGAGSNDIGLFLIAFFANGKRLQATVTVADNMEPDDFQVIVDVLAGIPGAWRVAMQEGAVVHRDTTPNREYEPLPPPPEG
jgi:hypothetical protein